MARPNISQLRNVGDYTQLYRWNLIFSSLPAAGIAGAPLIEDLNLRCESTTLPKTTNQPIEQNIRGHKTKSAGIMNYEGTIVLTFIETTDNLIHNFLKGWRELIWSTRTGTSVDKSDYEAEIIIQRLNNQDNAIWQYTMYGCWLEDYDDGGTLDGSTSDSLKPAMTISYDFFDDSPVI